MTSQQVIIAADPFHVGGNAYTVVAYLGGGRAVYHEGPKDFAYFTQEQAERLARRVNRVRVIDPVLWQAGEWDDMSLRDLEDEYEGS